MPAIYHRIEKEGLENKVRNVVQTGKGFEVRVNLFIIYYIYYHMDDIHVSFLTQLETRKKPTREPIYMMPFFPFSRQRFSRARSNDHFEFSNKETEMICTAFGIGKEYFAFEKMEISKKASLLETPEALEKPDASETPEISEKPDTSEKTEVPEKADISQEPNGSRKSEEAKEAETLEKPGKLFPVKGIDENDWLNYFSRKYYGWKSKQVVTNTEIKDVEGALKKTFKNWEKLEWDNPLYAICCYFHKGARFDLPTPTKNLKEIFKNISLTTWDKEKIESLDELYKDMQKHYEYIRCKLKLNQLQQKNIENK